MYFHGTLSIDPSATTNIVLVKPTRAFGKMLHYMTLGTANEREEHETFTAVKILQQFNIAFRSIGITNVVRLAKDDIDYYLDEQGRENDLKEAMIAFHRKEVASGQSMFEYLRLVLEHEDEDLKYLIQIEVHRTHRLGEHPIRITVNGLMNELEAPTEGCEKEALYSLMPQFESQDACDSLISRTRSQFDRFLDQIEQAVLQHVGVDNVSRKTDCRLIRPEKPVKRSDQWTRTDHSEPVYYGYHDYDDSFFYAWLWSEACHEQNIHCHDCSVVDNQGDVLFEVGEEGFDAGESNALNPDAPLEIPDDLEVHQQSDNESSETKLSAEASTETSGSWLDCFSIGDFGGDSGDGGGCGGGCGGG